MTGSARQPEMTAEAVGGFLSLMEGQRIRIWLDGGGAVDACLGAPTRRHRDLDTVIEERDVPIAVATLQQRGYAHTGYRIDETDWADVSALCARFGIPIPADYVRFSASSP